MHTIEVDHQFTRRKRVNLVIDESGQSIYVERSLFRCMMFLAENEVKVFKLTDGREAYTCTLLRDRD